MKKRTILAGVLSITALLTLVVTSASCTKNTDDPSTEATDTEAVSSVQTADETTEAPAPEPKDVVNVYHRKLYRSCLDWNNASETDSTGLVTWWKRSSCEKLCANMISVFPYYRENGKSVGGAVLLDKCYPSIFEYTKAGLEASHAQNLEVVTSLPMVLLNRTAYETYGYNWGELCQTNLKGNLSMSDKFGYACINNPKFQALVRAYTIESCKAGYDGMFFDGSPYSYGLNLNCCCTYCQETWKTYSLEYLGKETEIPTAAPTHTTKASRVLWKMRADIFINFVLSLEKECQAINPEFDAWPNLGINGTLECYYTLHGLKHTITEYGGNSQTVNPGYGSTLYMFRQYEAENPADMLISQFNSIADQATPLFKWKTAYVEAIIGGGSLMMPVSTTGTEKLYPEISKANQIIDANTEAFADSASAATVAIVYSWQEMNYCHLKATGLLSFEKNTPRKAAAALAARGIPYDYIMPENTTELSQLSRYKTIIFADFNLMSDDFAELVRQYVENGGQILTLGQNFASFVSVIEGIDYDKRTPDLIRTWTGTAYSDIIGSGEVKLGNGRIYAVKDWVTGSIEDVVVYSDAFCAALEALGCYDSVRVEEEVTGNVETALRRNADGTKYWLHLVTYNSNEVYDDKPVKITMTIPDGQTVSQVRADSVSLTSEQNALSWKQEGNKLEISCVIGLWTMISIEKGPAV